MAAFDEVAHLAAIGALEEAEILAGNDHARTFHAADDPFEEISDTKFVKLYRLTKPMASDLIDLLEPHITAPSRLSALSSSKKVLTALRFFAGGSYQLDIGGNVNHAICQSSVSRAIEEVSSALNSPAVFNTYVKLPQNIEELRAVRDSFYQNHQFPGVIGCIDCTHVAIYPPKMNDGVHPEAAYVNRKGYHSINVQLICDPSLKILNVNARYPGSTHDSFIWSNSNAYEYIHNLHMNGQRSFYFLGDSGYALRPWLLTPIANAQPNTPEAAYNQSFTQTRSLIERCNGVLKLRFRCLLKHRVLHYAPSKASQIINSCVVLHNFCLQHGLPAVRFGDDEDDMMLNENNIDYGIYDHPPQQQIPEGGNRVNADLMAGRRIQQLLLRNNFRV